MAEVLRAFAAAYPRALPVGAVLALIDLAAEADTRSARCPVASAAGSTSVSA